MAVTELIRVSITVSDLAAAAAFYRDWLKLEVGPEQSLSDPAWNTLLRLDPATKACAADVMLGQHVIRLVAFDPPGRPYPALRSSNDRWFQHVALVTGDIEGTWKALERGTPGVITKDGPVRLPANTGGVSAFKFRDPEGHPLELIYFPPGTGASVWHGAEGKGIFGYDHTAISVMDLDRSLAFYTDLLGFRIGGRSLNQGVEQDRLDGLEDCVVDVVALQPSAVATPHVELLHCRQPHGRSLNGPIAAADVASIRQVHRVDDLDGLAGRLAKAGTAFVSPAVVTLKEGHRAIAVQDPDGHMIVLIA